MLIQVDSRSDSDLATRQGHTAPRPRETTHPPAATQAVRPPIVKYGPCTATELTGRLGVIGLGAGQVTRNLVLTNTSGRACTLTGGPSEVTGVRRDGYQVRLATGASRGGGQLYGLVGPANLQPGHSAQAVLHTTDMCPKAIAGRKDNFIAVKIGISHSGAVQIDFPRGQPYNAVCGVDISIFGIPTHKWSPG
jgi:hypothetical protein